jgi:hypothetical protein
LPKDNENIPFFDEGPVTSSEPRGFPPDQMVRCDDCLRANPPTRLQCLYCGARLPVDEKMSSQLKPTLTPVEQSVSGYNNILLPDGSCSVSPQMVTEAASLLKLTPNDLEKIIATGIALPVARTSTMDEALLVDSRLKDLGMRTEVVADTDLALPTSPPIRVRALIMDETSVTAIPMGARAGIPIPWQDIVLIVTGRLTTSRVELKERKGRRNENEILEADQFYSDEMAVDIYSKALVDNVRIRASGFDFSCLPQKSLTVAENFSLLIKLIREKAPGAEYDDSYHFARKALELVLPAEQQTESRGWRRQTLGKFTLEAATEVSNEVQFTRYSRLRYYVKTKSGGSS